MLIELQNLIPEPIPQKIVEASKVWGTNLRIETNSNVLVSAQSGMGKSTLLHIIYGLRKDYCGQLLMDGTWEAGPSVEVSVPADTSLNLTGSVGDIGEGVIANEEVIASVSKRWPFPFAPIKKSRRCEQYAGSVILPVLKERFTIGHDESAVFPTPLKPSCEPIYSSAKFQRLLDFPG